MYVCWFALLLTTMTIGFYVKKSHDDKEAEREAINKESKDYENRQGKALRACMIRFESFSTSLGENQKAQHIYNGTDYLVGIKNYYSDARRLRRKLTFAGVEERIVVLETELYKIITNHYQLVKYNSSYGFHNNKSVR